MQKGLKTLAVKASAVAFLSGAALFYPSVSKAFQYEPLIDSLNGVIVPQKQIHQVRET